jgi:hypothetical protein
LVVNIPQVQQRLTAHASTQIAQAQAASSSTIRTMPSLKH